VNLLQSSQGSGSSTSHVNAASGHVVSGISKLACLLIVIHINGLWIRVQVIIYVLP
jgi:hypothetical protein